MPFTLIVVLVVLATESFITTWYSSAIHSKLNVKAPFKLPISLSIIKTLVFLIGIYLGSIVAVAAPWFYTAMAYAIMFIIGLKMIIESLKFIPEERIVLIDNNRTLILLCFAGSFNPLFIGLSLGLIGINFLKPVMLLLMITLMFSIISLYLGKRYGLRPFLRYVGIIAGATIAGIALRFFISYFLN